MTSLWAAMWLMLGGLATFGGGFLLGALCMATAVSDVRRSDVRRSDVKRGKP